MENLVHTLALIAICALTARGLAIALGLAGCYRRRYQPPPQLQRNYGWPDRVEIRGDPNCLACQGARKLTRKAVVWSMNGPHDETVTIPCPVCCRVPGGQPMAYYPRSIEQVLDEAPAELERRLQLLDGGPGWREENQPNTEE